MFDYHVSTVRGTLSDGYHENGQFRNEISQHVAIS